MIKGFLASFQCLYLRYVVSNKYKVTGSNDEEVLSSKYYFDWLKDNES